MIKKSEWWLTLLIVVGVGQTYSQTCGWLCQTSFKLKLKLQILNEQNFYQYSCGNQVVGDRNVCSGQIYQYKQSPTATTEQIDFISWTVGDGAEIVGGSGVDIALLQQLRTDYLIKIGIPVTVPVKIKYLFINDQNCTVNYSASLSQDISYTQNANGSITLVPDPLNPTAVTFTPKLTVGVDFSNKMAFSSKITKNCTDIATGDKGKRIDVVFDGTKSQVSISFLGTRNVNDACGADFGGNASVSVTSTPSEPIISGITQTNITCNQSLNLSTPYQNNVTIGWEALGAVFYNSPNVEFPDVYEGTNVSIGKFKEPGNYTIKTTAVSACGMAESFKTISVGVPNMTLNKSGQPMTGLGTLTCNEYNNQINLSLEPWVSSNSTFDWTLPAGWRAYNATPVSTTSVDGMPQYTYSGNNLRYLTVAKQSTAATGGDIIITGTGLCQVGGNLTKVQTITTPELPKFTFPANNLTCENQKEIIATFDKTSGTVARTFWSYSGLEGQFNSPTNQYNVNVTDVKNTFVARKFGNGVVSLRVTDEQGCNYSQSTNVTIYGGEGSEYISGWLSGHINPNQRYKVMSNIAVSPENNKIYFTRNVNGVAQIWFYQFGSSNKWEAKYAGVNDVYVGEKHIEIVPLTGDDLLLYQNVNGALSAVKLNSSTGLASTTSTIVTGGINLKGAEYPYGIKVIDDETLFDFVWKDTDDNLYFGILKLNQVSNNEFNLDLRTVSKTTIAQSNIFGGNITRYDLDKVRDRIIYFKEDGGVYSRKLDRALGVIESEIKLNGVLPNDAVWEVTDLIYDAQGNIYFMAQNDLYYVQFDVAQNYQGIYKIETREGLSNPYLSDAKGVLAINQATQNIYFGGRDNDVYQLVRKPSVGATPNFEAIRATPISFDDQVKSSMVYANDHLYYRDNNDEVSNLFYINTAELTCRPRYLREASEEFIASQADVALLDANAGELRGIVSPNPTTDVVLVDVVGVKDAIGELSIFNMQGEKINTMTYRFEPTQVDLSNLNTGVYIIQVSSDMVSKPVSFKIVKQ